ncbi:MAG: helix-turn-helix domain-containing protein [Proteobacteria bacterium]|nr:helix-turn-helix domain-containing protein [Pseudomonadota bacterium]MCA0421946.1 helix-turn-helix domain-containing protein [Pseudomonadota bacterium]
MDIQDRGALKIEQFCHWASIGRSHAYNEAKAGRLRLTKVGKKTLVTVDDAKAWLAKLPKANAAKAA